MTIFETGCHKPKLFYVSRRRLKFITWSESRVPRLGALGLLVTAKFEILYGL